ncbi:MULTISPECIES: response regulator [unclassified Beijerinckia]|uniref:response regulator n=1 Tax=unclassified Beijerinckia TaxID=2638183 RepID=UPI00089AAD9D|nr:MULTISPECIES: response regulator [unclassified Beijerinckia]MDH7797437.1 two-component system chemotaxis response regulator CheY [Beijerinckia sp. GAS462]SEC85520.1 response regulator receiver protein [Beijerinckia sp. 28-YEA-48]
MTLDPSAPILIVDDYATMLKIVRNLLKQIGYENVDDAPNGAAALEMVAAKQYALVISDWNMEPMTGYDLLIKMRQSEAHAETPFIMVTAESKVENIVAARKAGVSNYLVKPFNAVTLKAKIDQVFGKQAA